MVEQYKVIESASAKNTNINAGVTERVINECTYARKGGEYKRWNYLEVYNRDIVAIEIQLDEQKTGGKVYQIPGNTVMIIAANEGVFFDTVDQKNLDASTSEVANKIFFKAQVKELI